MPRDLTELRDRERAELVATLRDVGPSAPTLCAGWSAGDIAAHVAVAEQASGVGLFAFNVIRRLLPGRVTRRLIDGSQGAGNRLNARMSARGWDVVLRRLESGPPRLFRLGTLAQLRVVEEWIHHEDVRRANGLPKRTADAAMDAALWRAGLCVAGFPEFRLGREGIALDAGDGRCFVVGGDASRARIRVAGPPSELLLYFAGRVDHADVAVTGEDDAIAAARRGLRV